MGNEAVHENVQPLAHGDDRSCTPGVVAPPSAPGPLDTSLNGDPWEVGRTQRWRHISSVKPYLSFIWTRH